MADWKLPADVLGWVERLSIPLHARVRHRLAALFLGVVFAVGRRTVSKWIAAAGVSDDWKAHYYFLGSVGRKADQVGLQLMLIARRELPPRRARAVSHRRLADQAVRPEGRGGGISSQPHARPRGSGVRLRSFVGHAEPRREAPRRKAKSLWVWVVSRLRKDARLFDLPPRRRPGRRGRPPKYGPDRVSLAKRAAHKSGWQTGEFDLYGEAVTKTYKTFLATYPPAGGMIRVVVVKDEHGWTAFFSTNPDATVEQILEAVAARATIEQDFHDAKEVHGAGQQQLRNLHANIGAWHMTLWTFSLIELWAWRRPAKELVDRSARPWDDASRRPSHADKRNALRRVCLRETFSTPSLRSRVPGKIRRLVDRALSLLI